MKATQRGVASTKRSCSGHLERRDQSRSTYAKLSHINPRNWLFLHNRLRESAKMWYYDDQDDYEEAALRDMIIRAAFMQSLREEALRMGIARNISDEPQEIEPQQIEEVRRVKQAGPLHLNVPTIEPEFGRFFNNPSYSDIILVVGSGTFYAHRLILSSWSRVFQDVLKASEEHMEIGNGGLPSYRLEEDPDCCEVFDTFLKFLYTEEISFSEDTIMPLLKLSNKYEISELKTLCDNYVVDLKLDVSSAISVLNQAKKYEMAHTMESCISVLRSNFELISAEQLKTLDSSVIIALLDCREKSLVVKDEYSLFEKLTPWLANCTDSQTFQIVVGCIRFPFMSALQLKAVESSDIIGRLEKISPTFLAEAFEQHSLYREAFINDLDRPVPLPRLYMNSPISLFGHPKEASRYNEERCDEEGFLLITLNSLETCKRLLQNVLVNGRKEDTRNRFELDDSRRWFVSVKRFPQAVQKHDEIHALFGLKIGIERKSTRDMGYYPYVDRFVYRDEESHLADQVVEVAVQVKYNDESSHVFASKSSLTPKSRDKEGDDKDGIPLFSFDTPCLHRSCTDKVKIRASLLIHQHPKSHSKDQ